MGKGQNERSPGKGWERVKQIFKIFQGRGRERVRIHAQFLQMSRERVGKGQMSVTKHLEPHLIRKN